MKIGVISDVHGNIFGLRSCLGELERKGVKLVVCAGDLVGYYPFINEAIEELVGRGITTILGNHDAYLVGIKEVSSYKRSRYSLDWMNEKITSSNLEFLRKRPLDFFCNLDGVNLSMFHGSPWSIDEYIYPDHASFERFTQVSGDVVILGHTHYPLLYQVPGGPFILNPGSCGQPRDGNPRAAYSILDTETQNVEVNRVGFDTETLARETMELGFPKANIDILQRIEKERNSRTYKARFEKRKND